MPEAACAVTGANGYLGGALCAALAARGVRVAPLTRAGNPPYALDRPPTADDFRRMKVDALLHAAWDLKTMDERDSWRVNVEGSLSLFKAAREAGVKRILFISSLAAHGAAASVYGRQKYAVEKEVLASGGIVLRPGTIFGPRPGGLFGGIVSQVRSRSWLPVIRHPAPIFLAHEEDVANAAADAVTGAWSPPSNIPVFAANEEGWSLEDITRETAESLGRKVHLIPVPWKALWSALRMAELSGLRPAFRSDSLLSLSRPISPEELSALTRPPKPFRGFPRR